VTFIADQIQLSSATPKPTDNNKPWELTEDDEGRPWECEFCENTGWWIFRNHITKVERTIMCGECGNPYDLPRP